MLLPVGEAPEAVFQRYASLIVQHRQVELNNVRSFYKEAQKSPFKFFPWKQGNMHFRFLPVSQSPAWAFVVGSEGRHAKWHMYDGGSRGVSCQSSNKSSGGCCLQSPSPSDNTETSA